MITEGKDKFDPNVRREKDQLYGCLEYCQNRHVCRRTMQLEHFGEEFDSAGCNKTCDNCKGGLQVVEVDFTEPAKEVLLLINEVKAETNNESCTMVQLADLYRGLTSSSKRLIFNFDAITQLGKGRRFKKEQVMNFLHKMEAKHYLFERNVRNARGYSTCKVQHGPDTNKLLHHNERFVVLEAGGAKPKSPVKPKKAKKAASKKAKEPQEVIDIDDIDSCDDEPFYIGRTRKPGQQVKRRRDVQDLDGNQQLRLETALVNKAKEWAEIERQAGVVVRYWDILGNSQVKNIVRAVCLNLQEIKEHAGLPQAKQEKYGQQIVKAVKEFLASEGILDRFDKDRRLTQEWSPDVGEEKKKKKKSKKVVGGTLASSGGPRRALNVDAEGGGDDPYDVGIDFDRCEAEAKDGWSDATAKAVYRSYITNNLPLVASLLAAASLLLVRRCRDSRGDQEGRASFSTKVRLNEQAPPVYYCRTPTNNLPLVDSLNGPLFAPRRRPLLAAARSSQVLPWIPVPPKPTGSTGATRKTCRFGGRGASRRWDSRVSSRGRNWRSRLG